MRVALESTIITHGMPYPENVATARAVEGEVRGCGAEPATIAVIDGKIRVGLTDEGLEWVEVDSEFAAPPHMTFELLESLCG